MLFGNHSINVEGKSTEQIVDMIFKEREIRAAKEREDARLREQFTAAKEKKAEQPAPAVAVNADEPTGLGKVIQQVRKSLHL